MFRKAYAFLIASVMVTMSLGAFSVANAKTNEAEALRVRNPLNMAILIQDDLTSKVGNELGVTRDFIRALPAGSRVMVGYITAGTLQVRQPFTTDLNLAAVSLRMPIASTSASAYNPYVEVIEAMKKFDSSWKGPNAVLLISDGLDPAGERGPLEPTAVRRRLRAGDRCDAGSAAARLAQSRRSQLSGRELRPELSESRVA